MTVEKVTRDQLRALKTGESGTFHLPTYAAVESGMVSAYRLAKTLGCKFKCQVQENNTLVITRYDNDKA